MPHRRPEPRLSRGPRLTALFAGLAVVASAPAVSSVLELERPAVLSGQIWRLLTGHWTHWSGGHLAWDLLAFAIPGAMVERRGRRAFAACVGAAAAVVSAAVLMQTGLASYRGLSGIDAALYGWLWVVLLHESRRDGQRGRAALIAAMGAGFVAKILFEMATGSTFFVEGVSGVVAVPLAHLAGAAAGVALGRRAVRRS